MSNIKYARMDSILSTVSNVNVTVRYQGMIIPER